MTNKTCTGCLLHLTRAQRVHNFTERVHNKF